MNSVKLTAPIIYLILTLGAGLAAAQPDLTNRWGMRFVHIPAGTFLMGSPETEPGRETDETRHRVTLTRGFYMQTTEVTQGQWQAIMGENPSGYPELGENGPVEQVSWEQCQAFIKRLNMLEQSNAYRLPTEAEWEYACRAGTDTAAASGPITDISCSIVPHLDTTTWYCANSGFRPHPVARKAPNRWGLYDMQGNVHEWCLDRSDRLDIWSRRVLVITETYRDGIRNPLSRSGTCRVFRGGSWGQSSQYARAADRNCFLPTAKRTEIGLRLVKATD